MKNRESLETQKVWFVTGASQGLGLALVKKLIAQKYKVAATSRNVQSLIDSLGSASDHFLPIAMEICDESSVAAAIKNVVDHFGKIDVIVNNAGYSLIGTLEELSAAEVQQNFDVNVFGALHVIRYAAPHLRAQLQGHVFNIASIGGYDGGYPGFGIYCATKFAVVGFTEGLAAEMQEFGVKVTAVYPGYFRTNFLSKGSLQLPKNPIAEYTNARAMEKAHQQDINGSQPNDPDRAAEVLIEIASLPEPPVHLFLGKDAYAVVEAKDKRVAAEMNAFKTLATDTEFRNL